MLGAKPGEGTPPSLSSSSFHSPSASDAASPPSSLCTASWSLICARPRVPFCPHSSAVFPLAVLPTPEHSVEPFLAYLSTLLFKPRLPSCSPISNSHLLDIFPCKCHPFSRRSKIEHIIPNPPFICSLQSPSKWLPDSASQSSRLNLGRIFGAPLSSYPTYITVINSSDS